MHWFVKDCPTTATPWFVEMARRYRIEGCWWVPSYVWPVAKKK